MIVPPFSASGKQRCLIIFPQLPKGNSKLRLMVAVAEPEPELYWESGIENLALSHHALHHWNVAVIAEFGSELPVYISCGAAHETCQVLK